MTTTPIAEDLVHGAAELEQTDRGLRPHRLPRRVRERFADPQLALMEAQPSGVRIVLSTTSRAITLEVHATRVAYRGMRRPRGAVDIVVDGSFHGSHVLTRGDAVELDPATGESTFTPGGRDLVVVPDLPAGDTTVELWLPHNEQVDLVAVRASDAVRPVVDDSPVWLHHGSSISHGSNATSPTRIWPVVASRRAGMQLRNLGFGGSALVDPFMAQVIRDAPADLISLKLGINVVNLDAMRLRAFVPAVHGFLDTVRDGHPTTPLVLVSPIHCAIHEDTPGPGAFAPPTPGTDAVRFIATGTPGDTAGGRLTLEVIREALRQVVADRGDDPHLHHLDGLRLHGAADAEVRPLTDGLHPDTATHAVIGERFADLVLAERGASLGRPLA